MELKNKRYENIGIHVLSTIFTVDKGKIKILLVKRTNEPFKDFWALPSGALYNDELLCDGAKRELKEKTGITGIDLDFSAVFDDIKRSELRRMIGISFIGVINVNGIELQKETLKTSNADFFEISNIPKLAYDHNKIIETSLEILKSRVLERNILKDLLPREFTLPEIQEVYETLLNKQFDRRNFRKQLLNKGIIEDVHKNTVYIGKKPAKMYKFCTTNKKDVF
jgi:hydrolase, NUDIX family